MSNLHKQVWNNWWQRVRELPGEKRARINEVMVAPGDVIDLDVELSDVVKVGDDGLTFVDFDRGETGTKITFCASWEQIRGVTAGGETQSFHLLAARETAALTRRAGLRVIEGEKQL